MIQRIATIGMGTVGALAIVAIVGAPAGASGTVKVKPHTGLTNGQQVKIKAMSPRKDKDIIIAECSGDPSQGGECDFGNSDTTTSSSTGAIEDTMNVASSFTSPDGTKVNCTTPGSHACVIDVFTYHSFDDKGREIGSPVALSFASS